MKSVVVWIHDEGSDRWASDSLRVDVPAGTLLIHDNDGLVAAYAPGEWLRVERVEERP